MKLCAANHQSQLHLLSQLLTEDKSCKASENKPPILNIDWGVLHLCLKTIQTNQFFTDYLAKGEKNYGAKRIQFRLKQIFPFVKLNLNLAERLTSSSP